MKNIFKNRYSKIIMTSSFLVIILFQLMPINNAKAILGAGDIVNDPIHTALTSLGLSETVANWAWDYTTKIALEALKRRLLNLMTNEIIDWINNGTTPKFTQDFGSVFTQAGDAAVGDVLNQYALTQPLCQPFSFDIQFQLQQPEPFADQVRCSLSSVISNYSSYRNNFNNGGWLAYQELLKPQNNQWGVEIQTQSQIIDETNQKTNASILQQQVNVGFNSQACLLWQLTDKRSGQATPDNITVSGDDYPDPSTPPPSSAISGSGYDPQNYYWKCTQTKVTTPGSTMAAGLQKATYGNFDYIFTSQDLTNTLGVITDAAFNKLIKNGVNGIKDITKSTFNPPATQAELDATNTSQPGAAQDYQNAQNQFTENTRNAYLNQLKPAENTALAASSSIAIASSTNESVITTGNDLLVCLASNTSGADYIFANNSISTATVTTRAAVKGEIADINTAYKNLDTLISRIGVTSCGQTCLSAINSGDITSAVNMANNLNADASTMLLGIQNTLNDLQTRKTKDCNL